MNMVLHLCIFYTHIHVLWCAILCESVKIFIILSYIILSSKHFVCKPKIKPDVLKVLDSIKFTSNYTICQLLVESTKSYCLFCLFNNPHICVHVCFLPALWFAVYSSEYFWEVQGSMKSGFRVCWPSCVGVTWVICILM